MMNLFARLLCIIMTFPVYAVSIATVSKTAPLKSDYKDSALTIKRLKKGTRIFVIGGSRRYSGDVQIKSPVNLDYDDPKIRCPSRNKWYRVQHDFTSGWICERFIAGISTVKKPDFRRTFWGERYSSRYFEADNLAKEGHAVHKIGHRKLSDLPKVEVISFKLNDLWKARLDFYFAEDHLVAASYSWSFAQAPTGPLKGTLISKYGRPRRKRIFPYIAASSNEEVNHWGSDTAHIYVFKNYRRRRYVALYSSIPDPWKEYSKGRAQLRKAKARVKNAVRDYEKQRRQRHLRRDF